jgi:hypothetical protein
MTTLVDAACAVAATVEETTTASMKSARTSFLGAARAERAMNRNLPIENALDPVPPTAQPQATHPV